MRAVVLVGGRGSRLRPLTDVTPKPMLPVGHRPMIARLVDRLASAGVDEVTLALGFRPEPFLEAFPDGRCGDVRLRYAVEPEPLDTGGAIAFAARFAGIDDTFVVVNGDVMTDLDVSQLVAFHRARGAEATVHLTPVEDPSAFGVVEIVEDGRVLRFVEKPAPGETDSNLINAGTYVFEPAVLDRIPEERRISIERETFQGIVADGRLYAMATDDYWIDTGRPELYIEANLAAVDPSRADAAPAIHAAAEVDPTAVIERSVVGDGATVAARARIEHSVLLPGAVVDAGAIVRGSIVMGHVGRSAELVDCVVGRGATVPAGARRHDARVPEPQ